jgi:hypothetical protein
MTAYTSASLTATPARRNPLGTSFGVGVGVTDADRTGVELGSAAATVEGSSGTKRCASHTPATIARAVRAPARKMATRSLMEPAS